MSYLLKCNRDKIFKKNKKDGESTSEIPLFLFFLKVLSSHWLKAYKYKIQLILQIPNYVP